MSEGPGLDDLLPPLTMDDVQFMQEDLDQLTRLAVRGEALPRAGGSICALWGFLLAATNIYQAAAFSGWVPGPMPIGIFQVLLGYSGTFLIMHYSKKTRVIVSWRTQPIAALWMASGISICVFFIGCVMTGWDNAIVMNVFLSLIYMLNFAAMATTRRGQWLLIVAIGWIIEAILTFALKDSNPMLSLSFGISAFLFMFLPGLRLWWEEKSIPA